MDANASKYSIPTWGQEQTSEVTLPSKHKCLARRLSIPMLVKTGMLEKLDTISPEVEENITGPAQGRKKPQDRQAKKPTKKQQEKAAAEKVDSAQLGAMFEMMAVLIPEIVVEPAVLPGVYYDSADKLVEIAAADREQGQIYSDTIPINDQIHLFQWAMEGMDMEEVATFREQQSEGVESVADESSVQSDSE